MDVSPVNALAVAMASVSILIGSRSTFRAIRSGDLFGIILGATATLLGFAGIVLTVVAVIVR